MSCQFCQKAWFLEKLGRCQQCMWQANLGSLLLLVCCLGYSGEVAVYSVALWLAFAAFAGLSLAHWLMFFYYRWSTKQPPSK
ncbi:DUF3624 family protein [Agarivorans albus]|uniref:DUF3624 domain-containing protein n=1 Tax=Agarivorans albus MKT 106 TaxID=1331007 RepID=R9PRG7_AGAAL|nr:DUF3624 family protein [Agarivorans albus]GAD03997.1 hypothetical protein AALB_4077 [Agarivorans albus MKT 106]